MLNFPVLWYFSYSVIWGKKYQIGRSAVFLDRNPTVQSDKLSPHTPNY